MFALSRYMFLIKKYEKAEQQQTQVGQLKVDQQKHEQLKVEQQKK